MKRQCLLRYAAGCVLGATVMLSLSGCISIHFSSPSRTDQAEESLMEAARLAQSGDARGAQEHAIRARDLYRSAGKRLEAAGTLDVIGWSYQLLGDYGAAVKSYNEGLETKLQLGDASGVGRTLNNLAALYIAMNQYPKAMDAIQKAISIQEKLGDPEESGRSWNTLGAIHVSLGEYSKALDCFTKSLSLWPYGEEQTGTLVNMATIYSMQGESSKAMEGFEKALPRTRGDPVTAAIIQGNLGTLHLQMGHYEQASNYFQQDLVQQRKLRNRLGEANALANLGFVRFYQGQNDEALTLTQDALKIVHGVGPPAETVVLYRLGLINESLERFPAALDFFQQAIALLEKSRRSARIEEFKDRVAEQQSQAYQHVALILFHMGRPVDAFDVTERGRARTFLDQLGNTRPTIRSGAESPLIQSEGKLRDELSVLDRKLREMQAKPEGEVDESALQLLRKELSAKESDYEDTLVRLKLANPEYASLVSVSTLPLARIQEMLDPDTSLLSYFVTTNKTLVFTISRNSFQASELKVNEEDVRAALNEFRDADPGDVTPSLPLQQLYSWLIAPVQDQIKTPVIGIIPYGVLHQIPFAALSDGQHFLGEQHVLFHLPSASVLPFIQQKRKSKGSGVLALGQGRAEGLPLLQHAEEEAKDVAAIYDTQPLLGNAASESAFRSRAPHSLVIHLAAHGELKSLNPLFSRIILAADAKSDGNLEVQEIYGLDLGQTELVVLSACQTQLGTRSLGDELIGLNRAFLYAGVPTVVASLWSVDDAATGVMMKAFHSHLKQGMTKAQALQAAQTETRGRYPHPYYRAAFVLTGDPGRSNGPKPL